MTEDLMQYDQLAKEALRDVIRRSLKRVEAAGELPGEHHFYISFDTQASGVRISPRLEKQYPEEMSIVMQHQFWGLEVSEEKFSLELSFNNVPEKLTVPFEAIKGFFDPSVQFGLQFDNDEANENQRAFKDDLSLSEEDSIVQADMQDGESTKKSKKSKSAGKKTAKGKKDKDVPKQDNVVSLDSFRK